MVTCVACVCLSPLEAVFEFKCFLLAHAMGRGPKWSRDQLEDAARLFEAGVGPLEMVNLRPHWPLSTVKKLHVKLKIDMPLVRDVTTTVAQVWRRSWTRIPRRQSQRWQDTCVLNMDWSVTEQLSGGP